MSATVRGRSKRMHTRLTFMRIVYGAAALAILASSGCVARETQPQEQTVTADQAPAPAPVVEPSPAPNAPPFRVASVRVIVTGG